MTREQISQVYYLNREIEALQERLQSLRECYYKSPQIDGMPRGQSISDAIGNMGAVMADTERCIESLLYRIQIERRNIYHYISTLDDSLMRQIIMYRCISLCTWQEVAVYVGGNNTADSVRMLFNRHFEE